MVEMMTDEIDAAEAVFGTFKLEQSSTRDETLTIEYRIEDRLPIITRVVVESETGVTKESLRQIATGAHKHVDRATATKLETVFDRLDASALETAFKARRRRKRWGPEELQEAVEIYTRAEADGLKARTALAVHYDFSQAQADRIVRKLRDGGLIPEVTY